MHTRDGRSLHVNTLGTGRPTVILEAGLGASGASWAAVTPLLAAHTTVLTYDRSGLGRSPHTDRRRDLAHLAEDLVDVMGTVDGPVVLVGHSWGGPIVRCAAARVPDRVAALVLVDATDEALAAFLSCGNRWQTAMSLSMLPFLARTGLLRGSVRRATAGLPNWASDELVNQASNVSAAQATAAELATTIGDIRRLRADPPILPEVPLTVISGARASRLQRRVRKDLISVHRARAATAVAGRHVLALKSGHLVPITEPQLVANEVLRVAGKR